MNVHDIRIKAIRPLTDEELKDTDLIEPGETYNQDILCVEFIDGTILYPLKECVTCMLNSKCMFLLANELLPSNDNSRIY